MLGCLIEKRWTTPDQYPLSLNSLRLACNQSTNRDPVTDYDESAVRDAAQRLSRYGLARLASGAGSRSIKYRHLAEEGLGLDREQLAVLCVLVLRGPQTPGELKSRSDRMAHLATLGDVERVLGELAAKGYTARLERRPGQKEDRFEQLLGGEGSASEPVAGGAGAVSAALPAGSVGAAPVATAGFDEPVPTPPPHDWIGAGGLEQPPVGTPAPPAAGNGALEARVAALEADVAALRAELSDLLS